MCVSKWWGVDDFHGEKISPKEKFNNTLKASAKCRFIASDRLKRLAFSTSYATTILSLVMILLSLLQVGGVSFKYSMELFTSVQIFLTICILVYSVINTQAKYAVRAEKLNDCGNKILQLQRSVEEKICNSEDFDLSKYRALYDEIEVDSENHAMSDFYFAKLRLKSIYRVTGLRRYLLRLNAIFRASLEYLDMAILYLLVLCILSELLTGTAPVKILGSIG
ncbi:MULTISPECIES: SLATT domain-containing protein [Vibrio]|uniref:SLATT domain-containing protein n=1 Tax=Vibrio TaxID=662 RepID=UPI0014284389|nr:MULTISPECIES: SLATT domain-containing protein [Vibrio]MCF7456247.1 SLATT domain-containing protein [Vibrio sp. A1-1]QIS00331.1 SLATT domain-containing protein [Vibrio diabolicus]